MDYLDAHQNVRLECLKLLASRMVDRPDGDLIIAANALARFIIEGGSPTPTDTRAVRAEAA